VGNVIDPREQPLRAKLLAPFAALGACPRHVEVERLAAHAASELDEDEAHAIDDHLARCDDGRCIDALREVIAGRVEARDALYGARPEEHTDPRVSLPQRQGAHTFQCDGALWETFEALAREEGCSTDWLINEAMRAWAQQRPIAPRDVAFRSAPPPAPPVREPLRERNTPTLARSYLPKAPASSRRSPVHAPASQDARLAMVIEGVLYEVTKDRFVVGRGGRSSDVAIDDPGVSRQHALIEHAGGAYWLVDMGSTNGIEYEGERIARQKIEHGARFRICDHEIEFLLH
jgi:hypothetical protein